MTTTGFDKAIEESIAQISSVLGDVSTGQISLGFKLLSASSEYSIQYQRQINNGATEYQAMVSSVSGTVIGIFTDTTLKGALTAAALGAATATPSNIPLYALVAVSGYAAISQIATNAANTAADTATLIMQSPIWNSIYNAYSSGGSASTSSLAISNFYGNDISLTGVDNFDARFNFNGTNYLDNLNGDYNADEVAVEEHEITSVDPVTQQPVTQTHEVTFVKRDAVGTVDNKPYLIENIFRSVQDAGSAVANFISDLGANGTSWFSSGDASLSFATWLGANIGDLIDGTLDADDALIALATHLSQDFLADHLIRPAITSVAGAEARIATVLEQLGVSDGAAYAGAINTALGRIALDFVTSGFDAEQALNAGIATLGGAISQVYLAKTFGWTPADSAPAVAGVTTVINGLIHAGGFDSGDWAMLGVANDNCMMKREMVG